MNVQSVGILSRVGCKAEKYSAKTAAHGWTERGTAMRLIDADTVVHWQTYDDEHETFPEHEGTIADLLDQMTDEGCPDSVDALPSALQEAIRRIEKKVDEVYGYPKTEYAEGYVNACKAAIKMLKSLSTVDAVPVRHGRWEWDGEAFVCSACGSGYNGQPTMMGKPMFEFCPMCGADMRKDGEAHG